MVRVHTLLFLNNDIIQKLNHIFVTCKQHGYLFLNTLTSNTWFTDLSSIKKGYRIYFIEQVNHPTHYNLPGKKECIEQMLEDYGLEITITFCLANAYKYLYRTGNKINNPQRQDLEKAIWYYHWAKDHGLELLDNKKLMKLHDFVKNHVS